MATSDSRAHRVGRRGSVDGKLVSARDALRRANLAAGVLFESRSGLATKLAVLRRDIAAGGNLDAFRDLLLHARRHGSGTTQFCVRITSSARLGVLARGTFLRAPRG